MAVIDSSLSLIHVRGLTYRYQGGIDALCGLDLDLRSGSRLAIIGSNGAGKSTLFLHLNGTLRPDSGTISIDNSPADYSKIGLRWWRQQVGLVFQNPEDQLFAPTVEEDISFGPLNLGLGREVVRVRVRETLRMLMIEDLAERNPWTLSHGQKRLVAVAGVVAMRPRLLILDEPLSGLDWSGASQLMRLLKSLELAGITIVMATHDVDFAATWAEQIAIIDRGRLLCQGAAAEILTNPDLLANARLPVPLVAEIWMRLRRDRLIGALDPLPSSHEALLDRLDRTLFRKEA